MAPCSATCRRPQPLRVSATIVFVAFAAVAFSGRPVSCQSEKRLSSVVQQQQQYYVDSDDGGEVIKNKIRPDTYSQHPSSDPVSSSAHLYEKQLQQHKQKSANDGSTGYGGQYEVQQDQPMLDEEAQESISSGSINNHRIPQYTRNGSPAPQPAEVVEGKTVGNRAVGNNYNSHGAGSPLAGYAAVDPAYNPNFSTQDLIQDQNYQLEFKYHDYDKMTKFLRTTSSKFPNLTALYSIGKSVQGTVYYSINQ